MVFLLSGDVDRAVRGLDSVWAGAATLTVSYHEGKAMDFLLSQRMEVQVFPWFGGGRLARISYLRPSALAGWGVEAAMEQSTDLASNGWRPVEDFGLNAVPIIGTALETVTLSRVFPAGEPLGRLFLRLRVSEVTAP